MAEYTVTLSQAIAALVSDPKAAAKILVDSADEQTSLGAAEPFEDMMKPKVKEYIERGLTGLIAKINAVSWQAEE